MISILRIAFHQAHLRFIAVAALGLCHGLLNAQDFPGYEQREAKWKTEFKSGRFKIHGDFTLKSPQSLVSEFNALEQDIQTLLKLQLPKESEIHLVLFQTAAEYQRYMQNYFPALPQRRALFIQDRGPGMLFAHWHRDLLTDLRHEVTHALLNDGRRPLPLWLDEGLAEYFEPKREQRFAANSYLVAVAKLESGIQSIRELQAIADIGAFSEDNYRDSWAWVHYLIHRQPETRGLLTRYLEAHMAHAPTFDLGQSLERIFPRLREDVHQHFLSISQGKQQPESNRP